MHRLAYDEMMHVYVYMYVYISMWSAQPNYVRVVIMWLLIFLSVVHVSYPEESGTTLLHVVTIYHSS